MDLGFIAEDQEMRYFQFHHPSSNEQVKYKKLVAGKQQRCNKTISYYSSMRMIGSRGLVRVQEV